MHGNEENFRELRGEGRQERLAWRMEDVLLTLAAFPIAIDSVSETIQFHYHTMDFYRTSLDIWREGALRSPYHVGLENDVFYRGFERTLAGLETDLQWSLDTRQRLQANYHYSIITMAKLLSQNPHWVRGSWVKGASSGKRRRTS